MICRQGAVLVGGVALAMLSGCLMFYTGSVEGPVKVVAERNEPGQPKESILQVGGRANWDVVVGPEGSRETHISSLHYYIASGGKTNSISHATKWAYDDEEIEDAIPIRGTDRWMLAYAEITSGDMVTLDIRLFTAHKLIAQHEVEEVQRDAKRDDLRGYGVCLVSSDGRTITIPTAEGDCVLDGVTGKLTRPPSAPDRAVRTVDPPKGVSLYDVAADRILWTVPDEYVVSSRTDTNTFITCTSEGKRRILRLRDEAGAELVRREIFCDNRQEMAASPHLNRAAYLVNPNGGELKRSGYRVKRAAALCVETFGDAGSTKQNIFGVGEERDLEFRWITDDVLIENGVGIVFTGMRHWMLVGWDGKLIKSDNLPRKWTSYVDRALGHERLAVELKDDKLAVLLLKENRLIKGCDCLPSLDGKLLIGSPFYR